MEETVLIHLDGEGQTIPLPASIAASDDLIRRALAPFYPNVASAEIKRETKDGATVISIIKRAGPKGADETVTIVGPAGSFTAKLIPLALWDAACRAIGAKNTSGTNLADCLFSEDEAHFQFEAHLPDGSIVSSEPCIE